MEVQMSFRSILAAAVFCAALPAFSTPQPVDATGLWVNPAELGWGISVYHQGDTLFASLFVYGPDGQPKWYTASGLVGGPSVYTGPLIEATGPYFGSSEFNPATVTRRSVGTMTLTLSGSGGTVEYSVDGVSVIRPVNRFSIKSLNLGGSYYGVLLQPASAGGAEIAVLDQHITVQDDGATLGMSTSSNRTASCTYGGSTRSQEGETLTAGGIFGCPGRSGPWSMTVDPTPHGFVGAFSGNGISQGRIAAARRSAPDLVGTGWINDLWFPPGESGWGLNLIEQGGTAFATLFIYDSQNRPHWYSASEMVATSTQGLPAWSGKLYESTGPYFGTAFNPAAVMRREVGTMTFSVDASGEGRLQYSVLGLQVVKQVRRYAFRKNDLSGSYQGHVVMRSDDPRGLSYDDATFTIDDRGDTVSMSIDIDTGPKCDFNGSSFQFGSQRSVSGTYACQGGAQGAFRLDDLMVTAHGLTGTYQGPAGHIGGLITNGHISGARR
jgi:hypothetical protein